MQLVSQAESWLKAIMIQAMETYGEARSPIRANFQKMPKIPVVFLSSRDGHCVCTYVQEQISKRITCRSDWKLNRALMGFVF